LWSASGVFDVVQTALDQAWRVKKTRSFVKQRLLSVATISLLGGLFILSLFVSTVTDDVIRAALAWTQGSVALAGRIASFITVLIAFVILYKFFPHVSVSWRAAWAGAVTAALLWEIAKTVYGVYLIHFARFNLVYGSVGAVIGLLLWGYISATIVLFGAELSATMERETTQVVTAGQPPAQPPARVDL
jgi:membrane protein